MSEELKPPVSIKSCPFCGAEPEYNDREEQWGVYHDENCPMFFDDFEGIYPSRRGTARLENWNRRAEVLHPLETAPRDGTCPGVLPILANMLKAGVP